MFCIFQPKIRRCDGSQGQIPKIYGLKTKRISTVRLTSQINLFFSLEAIIPLKVGDTSTTYWELYGREAEIYDENLVDTLKGNTQSLVFLVSGEAHLRLQVYIAVSYNCHADHFILSAVGCALTQRWCDEYKKYAHPRAAPHTRGLVRTYLFQGLEVFQMRGFVYGIHVLLQISVYLFFWALSDFFYTVNHQFGTVTRNFLFGSLIVEVLLSISPLIFNNSPYNTPMTPPIRAVGIILRIVIRTPLWLPRWIRGMPFDLTGLPSQHYEGIHFDRARLYAIEAGKRADKLEPQAMKWLFTDNDFSDSDMDKFLERLPGYM